MTFEVSIASVFNKSSALRCVVGTGNPLVSCWSKSFLLFLNIILIVFLDKGMTSIFFHTFNSSFSPGGFFPCLTTRVPSAQLQKAKKNPSSPPVDAIAPCHVKQHAFFGCKSLGFLGVFAPSFVRNVAVFWGRWEKDVRLVVRRDTWIEASITGIHTTYTRGFCWGSGDRQYGQ